MSEERVRSAIGQWRDSLVNLSSRNRLINYRPTRSSTIEFTRHDPETVFSTINSPAPTFTKGTRPPEKTKVVGDDEAEVALENLEEAVLSQIHEFDFDSYPDHLFADKTQREVDKCLRNLAGIAKREFLDKGLRVLYLALGELRWLEDSGDKRRSPLLLLPVELTAPGPRERMYVEFSDDDVAINPALALRLSEEYGIDLPLLEDVLAKIENDGIAAALDLFRQVEYPDGWEVAELSALGAFMFAKEAMYRDLLDNEARIEESGLIQALAGGGDSESGNFLFEPYGEDEIDTVSPPETAPLVLDADASQRAAIQAAVEGRSFTLDGPPGTGKSQTIANMIAALIAAGKSVLFVSEKAVALDVVRDRLSERGLEPFLFELHSSKAARKEVASKLGQALSARPLPPPGMSEIALGQLREARRSLSDYAMAANELREPLGASFHQVLGWLEQANSEHVGPGFAGDVGQLSAAALAEVETVAPRVERTWELSLQGNAATWFGLREGGALAFPLNQLRALLDEMAPHLIQAKSVRSSFDMSRISDLPAVEALLAHWHAEPGYHDDSWLDVPNFAALLDRVGVYESAVTQREERRRTIESLGGPQWQELKTLPTDRIAALRESASTSSWLNLDMTEADVKGASAHAERSLTLLREITRLAQALATSVGAKAPSNTSALGELITAVRELLNSATVMRTEWIYNQEARSRAGALATQCQADEKFLESAETRARVVFTDATLLTDIDELERLVELTRGIGKRFSADHRRMRALLSTISPAKWKVSRDALPQARAWVDAHRQRAESAEQAKPHLGSGFSPGGGTDWDKLAMALRAAEAASATGFYLPDATQILIANESAVNSCRESLVALQRVLAEWRGLAGGDAEGDEPRNVAFDASDRELIDALSSLSDVLAFVSAQSFTVGPNASLRSHLDVAVARALFDEADASAQAARIELAEAAKKTPDLFGVDPSHAEAVRHRVRWASGVFEAAKLSGSVSLTSNHLQALRSSQPATGIEEVVRRYADARQAFLLAFDDDRAEELQEDLDDFDSARELVDLMLDRLEDVDDWFELQRASSDCERLGLGPAVTHARQQRFPASDIQQYLRASVYRSWLDHQLRNDARLVGADSATRDGLVEKFRRLDAELAQAAVARVIASGVSRRPKSQLGQAAVIRREAEKKRRHIAVRDLIAQSRDVIMALHPCFMMSPLAVSQYLPPEQLFDVVIFDEASQVMPADSINCIYRASAVITAGDQKQLPPTSFFEATAEESDDEDAEDLAHDYESILDLMKSCGAFTAQSLRWHYRSRHEHLIAYSNASFYQSRLITFPGAVDESEDAGVHFLKVPGVYRRSAARDNPIEARHVAERVIHHFSTRPGKSLGVVAFSTAQRDAIDAAVELARAERPDLDDHFTDERGSGFFVKSLESVQGDERDVIIFSIGYGPDENGKIYRTFGPVSRSGGERRLNVAVTRAKQLVEVVSSMSASDIGDVGSEGGRHLRRYLDFAERGPAALALELGPDGLDTESPFEDAVMAFIRGKGFDVQPQVGVAGYRIDLGVRHPTQPGAFMLGVECDGAAYHSSKAARDRDRIRHQILEGLGWQIHHIWGTAWYRHPEREKARLSELLDRLATRPVSGRVSSHTRAATFEFAGKAPVEYEFEEHRLDIDPDWVVDYKTARVERIPRGKELGDIRNARWLGAFVEAVARVEAPVHIDLIAQRIRENSQYDRIGARIRQTLLRAAELADVDFDGEWVRSSREQPVLVRRPVEGCIRTVAQVPDEEMRRAVVLFVADAVGVGRAEVVTAVAGVFGWRRTGPDIRARLESLIAEMTDEGLLVEGGGGLVLGSGA
ncbi:DUF3320 domain-containing protein [Microcella alkalica]|uniref:DUF3320 domain-containing protein n=1 Tax=Microcella alkalica TaxID=355930 RepID=UPI00145F3865|nr:DUF3320 domain-containing protein [Microcella alkalica]